MAIENPFRPGQPLSAAEFARLEQMDYGAAPGVDKNVKLAQDIANMTAYNAALPGMNTVWGPSNSGGATAGQTPAPLQGANLVNWQQMNGAGAASRVGSGNVQTRPLPGGNLLGSGMGGLSSIAAALNQLMSQQGSGLWSGPGATIGDSTFGPRGANWMYPSGSAAFDDTHGGAYPRNQWSNGWNGMYGGDQQPFGNPSMWSDETHGMQQPTQFGSYQPNPGFRPPQTNWGGGYGSRQGQFYQGGLSQLYQNGWGR